jgi:2-polyprenyl-6-methoxyphenol hydroxylase-like FAD-dependent oxidoreductase
MNGSYGAKVPESIDVLVVGAGPTGLALAAELRRCGVEPLIVDQHREGANTSRAAVVHARTLEILETIGATPELIARGVEVPIFRIRDRDSALITIDFRSLPSRYRFTLMCPQDETEAILLRRLQAFGGDVLRPWRVTDVRPAADRLRVTLSGEGSLAVAARYVVGCDGMHSFVRENAGIAFSGDKYHGSFVLADVDMDWPLSREEVSLFFSPAGLVVVAPLPDDRFRVVAVMEDAPERPALADIQSLLNERGPARHPARVRELLWSSRFFVHHRIASEFWKDRILLAGDAAHVHSPAGGQGMNTGIQDAIELARALVAKLQGADDEVLDKWAIERRNVARRVVRMTDRLTRAATLRARPWQTVRNAVITTAGYFPPFRRSMARRLAELRAS